jgi:flavin reductase (DIM6/NTAB) family NADH-FMN oxidoreductase RutF/DNA-binding GntR family transcriptional regulator
VPASPPPAAVSAETFREVIGHFATGVTVVTAADGERWFGTTASAVSSLSLEPPMLLTCMNRESTTGGAVDRVGVFAINILAEDQDDLARRFARKGEGKFAGVPSTLGTHGEPLLDGALAHLECRVTERVAGGTHVVFLAEVERALAGTGTPLAYFRGKFGRLSLVEDEQAYVRLRTAVVNRELPGGVRLEPEPLALRLGLPAQAAERALLRLSDEGLLALDSEGGFHLPPLTSEAIEDAFRARLATQIGAAVLTVGHLSSEQLRDLRAGLEATMPDRSGGERLAVSEWFEANRAFHEQLLGAVGSRSLVEAHRQFDIPGLMTRALGPDDVVDADLAVEHLAIVEAYERGDLDAACTAIRRDCERGLAFHRQRIRAAGGCV